MGFVVFAVAMMILNLLTGGAMFGVTGPVLLFGGLFVWRRAPSTVWPRRIEWRVVGPLIVLLVALYFLPVLGGSSIRTGDPSWHLGWTNQLLGGEPIPSGPAPEFAHNAYPWGVHAVLATMVRLVPGTDAVAAYEALHLIGIAGLALAGACVARRLRPDAGWAGAAAMSLIGGFAWLRATSEEMSVSPSEAMHGADLVVASPNSVYELYPPGLPRELGLVLLAACIVLSVMIARGKNARVAIAAGICAGLVGLTSLPLFIPACAALASGASFAPAGSKRRAALAGFLPAVGILFLWIGPVVSSYLRFGGFVDVTPRLGVEWPLQVALASWGLLLPLALGGIVILARSSPSREAKVLLAFAGFTALFVGVAILRRTLDWDLGGNETLLHQGRGWPVAHLVGAGFAGVALAGMTQWVRSRSKGLAVGVLALVLTLGMGSLSLASTRIADLISRDAGGYVYATPDTESGSFVRRAATELGPDDIVRVAGSDRLAFLLFQFSGCRITGYEDPLLEANDLRIRYRDLALAWRLTESGEGFEPDYLALPGSPPSGAVATGLFEGETWHLVAP